MSPAGETTLFYAHNGLVGSIQTSCALLETRRKNSRTKDLRVGRKASLIIAILLESFKVPARFGNRSHFVEAKKAIELESKILELQSLMVAYATDGRTSDQPAVYRELYAHITIELELAKYPNPNPHKSLEVFFAFCKLKEMKNYASRRAYVEELYADVLLDLKRTQRHAPSSKSWSKANDELSDELAPIRTQWLKAKNFIYSATPDYENSIKE